MKKWLSSILVIAFILALCRLLCSIASLFAEIPVAITMRAGCLSDAVLQVNNKSADRGYRIRVYVRSESDSSSSATYFLRPSGTVEFGKLEMDWNFKEGDSGFVEIDGNVKKVFFWILSGGKYSTEESARDLVLEVDVAQQKQARLIGKCLSKGRELVAIFCSAKAECSVRGCNMLWPNVKKKKKLVQLAKEKFKSYIDYGAKKEQEVKEGAADDMAFQSLTEYVNWLLDAKQDSLNANHPLVAAVKSDMMLIADENIIRDPALKIQPNELLWSMLSGCQDELSDSIPILVSANFPCGKLLATWDGTESDEVTKQIKLQPTDALKGNFALFVYNNGRTKVLKAEHITLKNIYGNAFNTYTNGCNSSLTYLTPSGNETIQP